MNQEVLRLMIHNIQISESTKEPTVTLELFYKDDDGNWVGGGPITMAVNNTVSLFAGVIAYSKFDEGNGKEQAPDN